MEYQPKIAYRGRSFEVHIVKNFRFSKCNARNNDGNRNTKDENELEHSSSRDTNHEFLAFCAMNFVFVDSFLLQDLPHRSGNKWYRIHSWFDSSRPLNRTFIISISQDLGCLLDSKRESGKNVFISHLFNKSPVRVTRGSAWIEESRSLIHHALAMMTNAREVRTLNDLPIFVVVSGTLGSDDVPEIGAWISFRPFILRITCQTDDISQKI